jgi:hypothetical protein
MLCGIYQVLEREEFRRIQTLERLVNIQTAGSIRTIVLTGIDPPGPLTSEAPSNLLSHSAWPNHETRRRLVCLRAEVLSHLLPNARGLRGLELVQTCFNTCEQTGWANKLQSILTNWTVCLPIIRQITHLTKLRSLCLQLSPYDQDQGALPAIKSLWHLKLVTNWSRNDEGRKMSKRIDLSTARLPRLSKLTLQGPAPSHFLRIFDGDSISVRRCVIVDLTLGEDATEFFQRISLGLLSLTFVKADFRVTIKSVFSRLIALKFIDVDGFPEFQVLQCPRLSRFSYHVTMWSQEISLVIETMIPAITDTLKVLELKLSHEALTHVLSRPAVTELIWCQQLRYILLDGPIFMSEKGLEIFGASHFELDMMMTLYTPKSDDFSQRQILHVRCSITGC